MDMKLLTEESRKIVTVYRTECATLERIGVPYKKWDTYYAYVNAKKSYNEVVARYDLVTEESRKKKLIELFEPIEHEASDNILYYLKLSDGTFKIGITSHSVARRYSGMSGYEILYARRCVNAQKVEASIKKYYARHLAYYDAHLGTAGTEIFSYDVLDMTKEFKGLI